MHTTNIDRPIVMCVCVCVCVGDLLCIINRKLEAFTFLNRPLCRHDINTV